MKARFQDGIIELSGESQPGDDVTVVASNVRLKNFTLGEGAIFYTSNIAKSEEEVEIEKKALAKAEEMIIPQRSLIQELFGSSMKILFRLGKSTYIETYTPDSDEITRVEVNSHKFTIEKGGDAFRYLNSKDEVEVKDVQRDVQRAIDDPKNNFKLISAKKMR